MLRKGCEGWSQLMDSNPPIPGEPPYFADLAVHLEVKNTSPEHGLWFASRACRDQFWYIVRMCPRGGFLRYIPPYGEAPGTGLDLLYVTSNLLKTNVHVLVCENGMLTLFGLVVSGTRSASAPEAPKSII